MLATCHEPVCGARDHKPVCPGDLTPTGTRGMDVVRGKLSTLGGFPASCDRHVVNQMNGLFNFILTNKVNTK